MVIMSIYGNKSLIEHACLFRAGGRAATAGNSERGGVGLKVGGGYEGGQKGAVVDGTRGVSAERAGGVIANLTQS